MKKISYVLEGLSTEGSVGDGSGACPLCLYVHGAYPSWRLCVSLQLSMHGSVAVAYVSLVQLYTELCISNVNVYRGVKYCMRKWALKQIRVVKIWRISDVVCKP